MKNLINNTNENKGFNEFELAILELDNIETTIQQSRVISYESQIEIYNYYCNQKKIDESFKTNVCYQTEFIEETYKDFLYHRRRIEPTLTKIKNWKKKLKIDQNNKTINWDTIIYSTNPNNLQNIIIQYQNEISDEVYWKSIAHCFTMSNMAHANLFILSYFLKNKRPNKHFLMTNEEKTFFDSLPQKITIYRGCSKKEIKSKKLRYSWTLNKSVAEFFAFEYINLAFEKSIYKDKSQYDVIERIIDKSEILAYFDRREEDEILYFPQD